MSEVPAVRSLLPSETRALIVRHLAAALVAAWRKQHPHKEERADQRRTGAARGEQQLAQSSTALSNGSYAVRGAGTTPQ